MHKFIERINFALNCFTFLCKHLTFGRCIFLESLSRLHDCRDSATWRNDQNRPDIALDSVIGLPNAFS